MAGSLLVHGGVILLLLSLNLSNVLSVARPKPVMLVAPTQRKLVVRPIPSAARAAPAVLRTVLQIPPRAFHPPDPPIARVTAPPTIRGPEPLRLEVVPLVSELPRPLIISAPPLKTDNLAPTQLAPSNSASRKVVDTAGFSSADTASQVLPRSAIQARGGFGDSATVAPSRQNRTAMSASPLTPVEILSKPRPAYTEEARRLQIQGEVLLEVLFGASGEASVERVVHGLGHGLDESATTAAGGIRFRPARRDGIAVDYRATVHITFELAN